MIAETKDAKILYNEYSTFAVPKNYITNKDWAITDLIPNSYVKPKNPRKDPDKDPGKDPGGGNPDPKPDDKWDDQDGNFTESDWMSAGQDWTWFGFDFQTDGVYLHNSDKNFRLYLKFCYLCDCTSNGGDFAFDVRYSIGYRREAGDKHSTGYSQWGEDYPHDNQQGRAGRSYIFEPNSDIFVPKNPNAFLDEGQYRLEVHVKSGLGNIRIGRSAWGRKTSIAMQYKWVNVNLRSKEETEHIITETIYPSGEHVKVHKSKILPKTGK